MQIATVGQSGLRVSRIGLGCSNLGAQVTGSDAHNLVHAATDAGVTLFDTADAYSGGESERLLGQALRDRRDSVVIASKFRHSLSTPGAGRKAIKLAVEGSLARLGTDYIDLYQLHGHDPATPLEETVGALQALIEQGKILYCGVCNLTSWQVADAHHLAAQVGGRLTAVQMQLSLLDWRRLVEFEPVAARFGLGMLAASPLARGLLGGRYSSHDPPPPGHPLLSGKGLGYWNDDGFATVGRLRALGLRRSVSPARLAIAALLSRRDVAAALVGASSPQQIVDACSAAADPFSGDDLRDLLGRTPARPSPAAGD